MIALLSSLQRLVLLSVLLLSWPAHAFDAPLAVPKRDAGARIPVLFSTSALAKSRLSASEVAIIHAEDNRLAGRYPIDEPRMKSHFPLGWGFLNLAQLEPGSYRLALYSDEPYYDFHPSSQTIRFEVRAGEPVYIGELQFELERGVGRLRVNDQSARDFLLFQQKNAGRPDPGFVKRLAIVETEAAR